MDDKRSGDRLFALLNWPSLGCSLCGSMAGDRL